MEVPEQSADRAEAHRAFGPAKVFRQETGTLSQSHEVGDLPLRVQMQMPSGLDIQKIVLGLRRSENRASTVGIGASGAPDYTKSLKA